MRSAQLALWDALIFLVIMMVATFLALSFQTYDVRERGTLEREFLNDYVRDTYNALARSTIANASCLGGNATSISMVDLLLVEISAVDSGLSEKHFEKCNERILSLSRKLVRQDFEFSIVVSYVNETTGKRVDLVLSRSIASLQELPWSYQSFSAQYSMFCFGKPGNSSIFLFAWIE